MVTALLYIILKSVIKAVCFSYTFTYLIRTRIVYDFGLYEVVIKSQMVFDCVSTVLIINNWLLCAIIVP